MFDKLTLCNAALVLTGNEPVPYEDDGSDPWIVVSTAWDMYLPVVLQSANWGFASDVAALQRTGDSKVPEFADRFAKPAGCLHVLGVFVGRRPLVHRIVSNEIHCTAQGSVPSAEFVVEPHPSDMPPLFNQALNLFLISACYRGINEQSDTASERERMAYNILEDAASRSGQENSPVPRINSGLRHSRNARKGWGSRYGAA